MRSQLRVLLQWVAHAPYTHEYEWIHENHTNKHTTHTRKKRYIIVFASLAHKIFRLNLGYAQAHADERMRKKKEIKSATGVRIFRLCMAFSFNQRKVAWER